MGGIWVTRGAAEAVRLADAACEATWAKMRAEYEAKRAAKKARKAKSRAARLHWMAKNAWKEAGA